METDSKYNNWNGIKRKCYHCRETFYINKDNIGEAIYYDKNTYHSSCFISTCNKRIASNRKSSIEKGTKALNNIQSIKENSYNHFNDMIVKEELFEFIKEEYDVTIVPTYIWHKLSNIYNGTYCKMSTGIPPEHLLDMWKRKIDMLRNISASNVTKGKVMDAGQQINYDLSVLVNKYDSYLKWLEKQKIISIEQEIKPVENLVSANMKYVSVEKENNDIDDISSLVDDIFG